MTDEITIIKREDIESKVMETPSNHGVVLSNTQSKEYFWTFLDDAGVDLAKSYNIDHSDHKNGIIKLSLSTSTTTTPTIE